MIFRTWSYRCHVCLLSYLLLWHGTMGCHQDHAPAASRLVSILQGTDITDIHVLMCYWTMGIHQEHAQTASRLVTFLPGIHLLLWHGNLGCRQDHTLTASRLVTSLPGIRLLLYHGSCANSVQVSYFHPGIHLLLWHGALGCHQDHAQTTSRLVSILPGTDITSTNKLLNHGVPSGSCAYSVQVSYIQVYIWYYDMEPCGAFRILRRRRPEVDS